MSRLEAEREIEAGLIAEGFRIASREPWPLVEFRAASEAAVGTMWYVKKRAGDQTITCAFQITDALMDEADTELLAQHVAAYAQESYQKFCDKGVPA